MRRRADIRKAVSIFCDWAPAALPIMFRWDLQMSTRVKVGIYVLIGLGFLYGFLPVEAFQLCAQ